LKASRELASSLALPCVPQEAIAIMTKVVAGSNLMARVAMVVLGWSVAKSWLFTKALPYMFIQK
jgi:hypothetical protein